MTLGQELILLREFQKRDEALHTKLEKSRVDKATVVEEIKTCRDKLKAKRAEIKVWQEKDEQLAKEFNQLVGESSSFYPALLRVFKRKIKRAKKKNDGDDSDEETESEEESDYDSDEGDSDEDEEDICPPGCDQGLYDKVLELRDKRLDQEEVLTEFQKSIEELDKASTRHQGREKQIDKDLTGTDLDIQRFQNEKQQKLNELDVVVILSSDQIRNMLPDANEVKEYEGAVKQATALLELAQEGALNGAGAGGEGKGGAEGAGESSPCG